MRDQYTSVAHAKLNLALHVVGRRDDGYHLLDSLVAFTQAGDHLTLRIDRKTQGPPRLTLEGPQAYVLRNETDNLITRAADLVMRDVPVARQGQMRFRLFKNLPVAAGIGGGSADAASALRLMAQAYAIDPRDLSDHALALGADVPMCLAQVPARIQGIGEQISPLASLPQCPVILVNPGVAVSTPDVFRALMCKTNDPMPDSPPEGFSAFGELVDWLSRCRNDLEKPAREIAPQIGTVLSLLRDQPGCQVARMSGSGATCWALFADSSHCQAAARMMSEAFPEGWVCASHFRGQ